MLVRTLRGHGNAYGAAYLKAEGDRYDHPSPATLIDDLVVEQAVSDPLDHDGDGAKGGSLPGEASTATIGRRRRARPAA